MIVKKWVDWVTLQCATKNVQIKLEKVCRFWRSRPTTVMLPKFSGAFKYSWLFISCLYQAVGSTTHVITIHAI